MRPKRSNKPDHAEQTVRDIRRATRRQYSAEEKIRIVFEGLRSEQSIAELCRKEGINQNLYHRWSRSSSRLVKGAWRNIWPVRQPPMQTLEDGNKSWQEKFVA